MGYFTKNKAAGAPAPLTIDRVAGVLDARGANYGRGDETELGGYWDGHLFVFRLLGADNEYLQVRGQWNRTLDMSELQAVMTRSNQWNDEKVWPKVYVHVEVGEDGSPSLDVYAEHTVDYEHGVTDEQLDLHLSCAIATAGQFFDALDEQYPAQAAEGKARFESD